MSDRESLRPFGKIFLIYGNLDDMFMTLDLQKQGFRPFLNAYLRSLGYEQIVYYSGAKNVGKFVLDDESAKLAINKNKQSAAAPAQPAQPKNASDAAPRRRRILNPAARSQTGDAQPATAQPDAGQGAAERQEGVSQTPEQGAGQGQQLVYNQPRITPFEFLDDARVMMASAGRKSAVVFTFMQDFLADRGPMQPYLELVSHLWDEYSIAGNGNICVFLAPQLTSADLARLFDRVENGDTMKNKFFNQNGTINRSVCIDIGLPNMDEIGYMLDYLRIVGEGGLRVSFSEAEKKRIASALLFLSREADRHENGQGSLKSVYENVASYAAGLGKDVVPLTDGDVRKIYAGYKSADEPDALEKLKNTRGWETVYKRVAEILKDFEIKRAEHEKKTGKTAAPPPRYANLRILAEEAAESSFYPVPHFILRGNPGVGKTTVARLIGKIFYDAGILKKGVTIEAKRDDLVDAYVGGTAVKTTECVESAREGVLFVDDAYSLLEEGSEHNYPKEALDTLVPIMTNPDRYRFCLIMAGYPEPMDKLLSMNAGLKSRFSDANILTIEDYRPDLLREIFTGACLKRGYRFWGTGEGEDDPLDLDLFFTNLYNQRNRADFGNARDAAALAGEVMLQSGVRDPASRCIVKADFGAKAQKFFERRDVSSVDDIYAELDGYVGLDFIKEIFKNVRLEILDARECQRRGVPVETYPDHYIFAGNPGTGKTTVGRLVGKFYHMMEVLGGAETLFTDASDLVGSHYGDSKTKVQKKIQEAIDRNCVLYVDEAYQIIDSGYAAEAVGAMMTRMTENAGDFKMIFGMYSNRVEEFLALNAGLSRRLRVVDFPDYTPEQLLEIFVRSVKAQGCTASDEVLDRMRLILTRLYDVRTDSFGNAGEVKKILAGMKRKRLERTEGMDSGNQLKYEYTLSDIPPELLAAVEDLVNPRSLADIMKDLNEQIGLSDLKDVILQKREELQYAASVGEAPNVLPGYYFFVGAPGTGKSTSARLFAECLHQLGVVKTNNFYSCTAKDLIGEYVGATDKKTYELLKKSINGVLFIDEAYSLSYDGDHSGGSFKKEALEQIIAFMDEPDHRKRCCLIFAGYLQDMQGLYRSNAGMRSRIEEVRFNDYTAEETYRIFELFCRKNGFTAAEGVQDVYVPAFARLKGLEYFANGRTARTIFEKTAARMKRRVVRSAAAGEHKRTILLEDLLTWDEMLAAVST